MKKIAHCSSTAETGDSYSNGGSNCFQGGSVAMRNNSALQISRWTFASFNYEDKHAEILPLMHTK